MKGWVSENLIFHQGVCLPAGPRLNLRTVSMRGSGPKDTNSRTLWCVGRTHSEVTE